MGSRPVWATHKRERIKTTIRYHYICNKMAKMEPIISSGSDDTEQLELLSIDGGKARWYSQFRK
jgi:hypothetical protein